MYQAILLRFGEISLKGNNRSFFVHKLIKNIKTVLKNTADFRIERTYGRIYIYPENNMEKIIERLKMVPGIVSLSPTAITSLNYEDVKKTTLEVFKDSVDNYPTTFKVETHRANKKYQLTSPEISRDIGAYLLQNINHQDNKLTVDVHNPAHTLNIEVRKERIFIYTRVIQGIGGLPIGTSGKGLLLLSGGIDSPVAGWSSLKRGMTIDAIYFHSPPYTGERAKEKVIELAQILSKHSGRIKLYLSHFTDIQMAIQKNCPPKYNITIMRRIMFQIADRIARENNYLALVTGESIGQVASQTLESMQVINAVTNLPVIRPLIAMDKTEIIDIARKIETYKTSILPYEDCCTLFVPKHPVTKPKLSDTINAETKLDIEELLAQAMEKIETIILE
ncbi:MAG: tRNA 4-thiouridine(8) synthase ThiI [Firmicutes bacterium]|nr:tRNA 4-thiouridine(8) synthase ThiI [Bacillota bacterium]